MAVLTPIEDVRYIVHIASKLPVLWHESVQSFLYPIYAACTRCHSENGNPVFCGSSLFVYVGRSPAGTLASIAPYEQPTAAYEMHRSAFRLFGWCCPAVYNQNNRQKNEKLVTEETP